MAIKGAKTIAEFAIRRWMQENHFVMECFTLSMNGNEGVITDGTNDSLTLFYDQKTKTVLMK